MVEWKPLQNIVKSISTGLNPRQNFVLNEDNACYYYVTVKEITTNKVVFSDSTDRITKDAKSIINNRSKLEKGDILFSGIGTIGKVAYVDFPTSNWDCSESVFVVKPQEKAIPGKFLSYILSSNIAKNQYEKGAAGAIMKGVRKATLENILIPIPSLSEQQRIVGILDTFTASIDNLKEQIAQRRKQYEYYRDQLLDLEGKPGVEMKTLGEVGECYAGATPSTKESSYWDNGTIPWMNSGEVHQGIVTHTASFITSEGYNNASTKMLPIDTVVIALVGQGKTRGSVAITAIELCTNQSICGVVIDDSKIINKYVYYYLRTQYNNLRKISSGEGTRGGLNLKMIGSYPILLPSLQEQQRIVSILDTFEASIQNLEAQLKQREKQYEYYRNKLLTFE